MNLQILQEAEAELTKAVAPYEAIEPGLGTRLKEEARIREERTDVSLTTSTNCVILCL